MIVTAMATVMTTVTGPEEKGVQCRDCGCCHSEVIRTDRLTREIRRSRRCRHCGNVFLSREKTVAKVVSSNGEDRALTVPFSMIKPEDKPEEDPDGEHRIRSRRKS